MKDGFFCYATTVQTIADNTTVVPQININNDSDFELFELRAVVYKLAVRTGSLLMSMSLGSGELFNNVAIDLFAIATQNIQNESGYPVRFPFYTRIPANSQINVQLTNDTDADVIVQVQLWGRKVYQ